MDRNNTPGLHKTPKLHRSLQRWLGHNANEQTYDHKGFEVLGWFSTTCQDWHNANISSIKNGVIVEIGIYGGISLLSVVDTCIKNNNVIYGIDPWEESVLWGGVVGKNGNIELEGRPLNLAKDRMRAVRANLEKIIKQLEYKNVNLIKGFSVPESENFDDESVDLILIDGNHSYEETSGDIKAWYGKLKPGGTLSGHDLRQDGVKKAVTEFATQHSLDIEVFKRNLWTIIKPSQESSQGSSQGEPSDPK